MISTGSPEGDAGPVRASEGGVGAGIGGFEAVLSEVAEAMRDSGAKAHAMPGASGEAEKDAATSAHDGVVDESPMPEVAQDEVAQEGAQDAQVLPEAKDGAGDVAEEIRGPERWPAQPDPDQGVSIDAESDDEGAKERPSIDRGSVENRVEARSREAASGSEAVRNAHEETRTGAPQQDGHVREATRQPAEPREPIVASPVARGNREESRASIDLVQTRPEPVSSRQPVEPQNRGQAQENRTNNREGGDQSNREPARGDQPLPRERNATLPPAAARAKQIDTAVRLEQATGRQASGEPTRASAAPSDQPPAQPPSSKHSPPPPPSAEPAVRIAAGPGLQLASLQPNHAPSTATTAAVDAARAEESPLTSRIVRGLTAMVNQRGGSLTMRLDPPELGSLRVQMTINRGTVIAQLTASTPQAHGLLEKNLAMLRTSLESHGLSVERLTVQLTAPSNHGSFNQQQNQQDGSGRSAQQDAHADAGEGESRGRREEQRGAEGGRETGDDADSSAFTRFIHEEAASTGATSR